MKTLLRILKPILSLALFFAAITPLIMLIGSHVTPGWFLGILLGCAAEWYRFTQNRKDGWVDRLIPKSIAQMEREMFERCIRQGLAAVKHGRN